MGVSGAVQWWEESQLRILVLASLVIQYILFVGSIVHAIAIYALATLFNRHRKPHDDGDGHGGSNSMLEVLWAPILLIHLGGQDGITAYNIEDNELWTRHILTSVSQVTVAVYVFYKSWSGDDKRLLEAAILFFIFGTLKCIEKPLAHKRASINSLVSSGNPIRRSINAQKLKIDPLEDFIDKATSPVEEIGYLLTAATPVDFTPYKLFVDLASPSADDRIRMLMSFSVLNGDHVYCQLQHWLSQTFQLLYTKQRMSPLRSSDYINSCDRVHNRNRKYARALARSLGYTNITEMESSTNFQVIPVLFGLAVRGLSAYISFGAIALFHYSRREAYSEDDVKVTYALLCCTAAVETLAMSVYGITRATETPEPMTVRPENGNMVSQYNPVETRISNMRGIKPDYDDMVSQYNLIGLLVRNRKHSWIMKIVGVLECTDFLQQRWHMKSSSSSRNITKLVFKYLKGGWEHHIRDVSSYKKFNDNRGQFTLRHQGCYQQLEWSLEGAFDESVLLWHLATDFCYYHKGASHSQQALQCTQDWCPHANWCRKSVHHEGAVRCREMSNYMMYLLFVNPEMLMPGTRRDLFIAAYKALNEIIIQRDNQPLKERELTQRIIDAVDGGSLPPDGTQQQQGGIIYDARSIAKVLCGLPEEKMWTVIKGVWVEMMCFSAARCRGYLHAKGLGTGVEYLTYVWFLQYYMGMETLAAKLQRADHHHHHHHNGGEHGDDPSTYGVRRATTAQEETAGPSRSSGGAAEEEQATGRPSADYHDRDGIVEEIV
ncbi:hypothetical protein ACQJBY_056923 [Aegilops geniculata]